MIADKSLSNETPPEDNPSFYTLLADTIKNINVGIPGWSLVVGVVGTIPHDKPYIQVRCSEGVCNDTGQPLTWSGRKWLLSHFMTRSEIVTTCLKAVLTAVEHETREGFLYKGVRVFDPHVDVDYLAETMKTEVRKDKASSPLTPDGIRASYLDRYDKAS